MTLSLVPPKLLFSHRKWAGPLPQVAQLPPEACPGAAFPFHRVLFYGRRGESTKPLTNNSTHYEQRPVVLLYSISLCISLLIASCTSISPASFESSRSGSVCHRQQAEQGRAFDYPRVLVFVLAGIAFNPPPLSQPPRPTVVATTHSSPQARRLASSHTHETRDRH